MAAAGLSGFYMIHQLDAWDRYASVAYWWVHAMSLLWLIFAVVLFVAEPLFLHAWFVRQAESNPEKAFKMIYRFHQIITLLSLLVVAVAIVGVHA